MLFSVRGIPRAKSFGNWAEMTQLVKVWTQKCEPRIHGLTRMPHKQVERNATGTATPILGPWS